jgi:uncharacterized protein
MLIGVLSDTHIPYRSKRLPEFVLNQLKGVDLILHAGDWQTLEVYDLLSKIAPVEGVAGNTDGVEVVQRLGWKKIIEAGSYRIGLVHGHGGERSKTVDRALETFAHERVDMIIFGHSHIPYLEERKGIILFNPGSPTDKRRQPKYSFGLVQITNQIVAKHIYF